jgi:hypothetical protein
VFQNLRTENDVGKTGYQWQSHGVPNDVWRSIFSRRIYSNVTPSGKKISIGLVSAANVEQRRMSITG